MCHAHLAQYRRRRLRLFHAEGRYGLSVRLYRPAEREWTVYWVDGRDGVLRAPVRGAWRDGRCFLTGRDEDHGRAVLASYAWSGVSDEGGHWEQAFSVDDGRTWETNWVMDFRRRATMPHHGSAPKVTDDFDFLTGRWSGVQRRRDPFRRDAGWREFGSTSVHHTYVNGSVSVDEFDFPAEGRRGLTLRLFQPRSRSWRIYWVSSTDGVLQPPVTGTFRDGVGEFSGTDTVDGTPVEVRFRWTRREDTARWEQEFSTDGGGSWSTNWTMDLSRERAH